ncbi:hypothetical protein EDD21DRAFT_386091 [Dissophora ornata]|nr:hypothetical protein BGZ58_002481 [Dissophora ornata]KAI8597180.1 hypothetical protein EDD21DRAFT_386091 [Dissophora ornata]
MINRTTSTTDVNSETLAPAHNTTTIANTNSDIDSYHNNADDNDSKKNTATLTHSPSQRIRLFFTKRTFTLPSFRNLLLCLRLLIFVLAFVTLILDAITISFEVNVMGLGLSEVSTQTALLLTPDLLAMMMVLILVIYSSEAICCCFGNAADLDNSYDGYEDSYDDEVAITRRPFEERESMAQTDQELEEGQEQDFDQGEREERLARSKGKRVAFINYPEDAHYTQHIRTSVVAITTPVDEVDIHDTLSYTHSPAASSVIANSTPQQLPRSLALSEPSTPTAASKPGRHRYYYVVFRVLFSLGLAVLALYWPARQMKPPVGYLPNLGYPPHHGNGPHTGGARNGGGSSNTTGGPSDYPIGNGINHDPSYRPGKGNDSGSNALSRWCAVEEAFGDSQSAVVYCQVKAIRPGLTYVWAVLVVVELCAAAMAGDFGRSGIKGDAMASSGVSGSEVGEHLQLEQLALDGPIDEEMAIGTGTRNDSGTRAEVHDEPASSMRGEGGQRRIGRTVH